MSSTLPTKLSSYILSTGWIVIHDLTVNTNHCVENFSTFITYKTLACSNRVKNNGVDKCRYTLKFIRNKIQFSAKNNQVTRAWKYY